MNYINFEQAKAIHEALVVFFEKDGDPISPAGIKSAALLESALFRPQTSLSGVEKYKTVDEKAAALLCSIIQNHPFHNGNKRTALVSTLAFYDSLGHTLRASQDDFYNFLINIAKGELNGFYKNVDENIFFTHVIRWLRKHRYSYFEKYKDIKTHDFIEQCVLRGAQCKKGRGGSHILSANSQSIKIQISTKKISASAVRTYIGKLKLSENYSGLKMDEILKGDFENNSCFKEILPLLRRLALV